MLKQFRESNKFIHTIYDKIILRRESLGADQPVGRLRWWQLCLRHGYHGRPPGAISLRERTGQITDYYLVAIEA